MRSQLTDVDLDSCLASSSGGGGDFQLIQGYQGCSGIHRRSVNGFLFSLRIVTGIGGKTILERNHNENKDLCGRSRSPPTEGTIHTNEYEKQGIETKDGSTFAQYRQTRLAPIGDYKIKARERSGLDQTIPLTERLRYTILGGTY
ncbi:hypothetical protein J6590_064111 [Homalodisca vitripennis]|nr:hypothetical protein J6590_064111 [Homalodisca vitripennis]